MKKLKYIDGLRGWAIILVIIIHSSMIIQPPEQIKNFIYHGSLGVQLFFILSALTLYTSMYNRKKIDKKPTLSFFIRRFFRIAPFFYIMMIVSLLYYGTTPRYWAPDGISNTNILLTVLFLNSWWPSYINAIVPGGWSIAVEMNFYILIPFLFKKINNLWSAIAFTILSFIIFHKFAKYLARFFLNYFPENQHYLVYDWRYGISLLENIYVFGFGIIIYFLSKKEIIIKEKIIKFCFYFALFYFIFCLYMPFQRLTIIISMALFVLFSSLLTHSIIITSSFITFIGKISFSLYFIHFYVNELIISFHAFNHTSIINSIAAFFLSIIISIPVATITHYIIEKTSINIGKKIIDKI